MNNKEIVQVLYHDLKKFHFVRRKTFTKGEIIANFIRNRDYIYFILNGSAALIRNTKYGDEELIEIYERYDFFGDNLYNIITNNEMSVVARNKCDVFYFDFKMIKNDIEFFNITNMIYEIINNKIKLMNSHMLILKKKTTRNKLLSYFNFLSRDLGSKNIYIDISYKELASYLCVDRSAMMREINILESDNLIKRSGKTIKILY